MNVAPPRTDPAWNEAHERVECYLRAHRIAHPIALNSLAAAIVARAWAAAGPPPRGEPVTLALAEADAVITDWFARVLGHGGAHGRRLGVRGRLALALSDAPGRWPADFLAPTPPPAGLSAAMRKAFLHTGPLPQLSKMTPRPLSLGIVAGVLEVLWDARRRSPGLRVVVRVLLAGAAGALVVLALR